MAVRGVAKRYAQAIFDIAGEGNTHEQWLGDLRILADAATDRVAGEFFTSPSVAEQQKRAAIDQLLPGAERQMARNLAYMLIERNRFDIVPDMLEIYRDLLLQAQGIAIADVVTAVELTPLEQDEVRGELARIVGREIDLRPRVDPSIIGGIIARVGDRLIDGSVVTQLQRMRAALTR